MEEVANRSDGKTSCRSRPNLVKACRKTKLCNFHLRGACSRGEDCTFAHDPSELQTLPDLQATKLCPKMLANGYCSNRMRCKYAHDERELRTIMAEDDKKAPNKMPLSLSSLLDDTEGEKESTTVESELNHVASSGALNLRDMILHLTSLFTAIFDMQPSVAERVGTKAQVLAEATATQVWADAGIAKEARMTFTQLVQWCSRSQNGTQSLWLLPESAEHRMEKRSRTPPSDEEADAWSRRSTEEGCSDASESAGYRTPIRCRTDPDASGESAGYRTPPRSDTTEDCRDEKHGTPDGRTLLDPFQIKVVVKNTFLDFRDPDPESSVSLRRSLSVPAGLRWKTRHRGGSS